MSKTDFDYIYKIIIIGDSGSGKTNLLSMLIDNKFINDSKTTIGIDFQLKTFNINGENVKIQFWDTAGQERFRSIVRSYYNLAAGVLIAFDLTRKSTFDHIENWINEVKENTDYRFEDIKLLLVGNKCDLIDKIEVSIKEIDELCKKYNLTYIETSAKENINVEKSINELVERVHKVGRSLYKKEDDTFMINIEDENDTVIKQGCCYVF